MRGAATITSPAVMSAMRITPSSIMRDSGSISSRCSASASVSISSSRESGPGDDELDQPLEQVALLGCGGGLVGAARGAGGWVRVGHRASAARSPGGSQDYPKRTARLTRLLP